MASAPLPKCILLFSGKRKSGKDFLTDQLQAILGSSSVILRLSGPLKECYAKDHGLDYDQLLSAGDYKEKYRLDMIKWSEEIRNKDFGYFCRAAIDHYNAEQFPVWIVSDCRRKTDHQFFEERFTGRTQRVRVCADQEVRKQRGFVFQEGVDNAESECGLDDVDKWDFEVVNNGDTETESLLKEVVDFVRETVKD